MPGYELKRIDQKPFQKPSVEGGSLAIRLRMARFTAYKTN
jgi:hypothetical protein